MASDRDVRTGFKKLVHGEGAMTSTLLTGLGEMLGTAILVLIGCTGCLGGLGAIPPHLQITLTFGLAVMVVIQCFGHISDAHVNPAITVGAVVLGKKTIPQALVYFFAQTVGAIIGYGMLKVVTPRQHLTTGLPNGDSMMCVTDIHSEISAMQGLLVEGLATSILMLFTCGVWDQRNERNTDSIPLRFGLTVTVLATAFGPYTGCSMNPARSLGPALWNQHWDHHWIYWFGPIGGTMITAFFYRTVFGVKEVEEEEETIPETVALNSVNTQKAEQV